MTNGMIDETAIGNAEVITDLIPVSNKTSRPQIGMNPKYITVHNTGNSNKGANAKMHSEFVNDATGYISWHFSVDDSFIIQELPVNEIGYHAGDGDGDGNRKSIGIEICENLDGDYAMAESNAIALINYLMDELDIPIENVVPHQHWSGKWCPHVILESDGGFSGFKDRIQAYKSIEKLWEQEIGESAIDKLASGGYINTPDVWKSKDLKNEPTPLWLFFEMYQRLLDK